MERFRGDPALADYYQELEEKHGIKVCWFRDGIFELPEKYMYIQDRELDSITNYIRSPALVDKFHLHRDRRAFWKRVGALGSTGNERMAIVYTLDRLKITRIVGARAELMNVLDEHNFPEPIASYLKITAIDILDYEQSLKKTKDSGLENVTLEKADAITEKLYDVCWALAEK